MNGLFVKVKPYRSGIGILVLGIAAFFIIHGNPMNDFLLMRSGITVQGIASDVNDFEDREDNGNLTHYFFIKYEFITDAGQKISDVVEIPGKSSDKGFRTGQSLEIQYLAKSPNINRIKALASTTLNGWILKNLLLGLIAIAPGSYLLYRSYQMEREARAKRNH